jgi:ActR/RegA family two-component response regulator
MAASSLLRDVRVLILEDDWRDQRSCLSLMRRQQGGARANVPDAAIVDVKLRDEMAFGVIERLQDLGIRVVVVSAAVQLLNRMERDGPAESVADPADNG